MGDDEKRPGEYHVKKKRREEDPDEVTQVTSLYDAVKKKAEELEEKAEEVVDKATDFERTVRRKRDSVQEMRAHLSELPPPPPKPPKKSS